MDCPACHGVPLEEKEEAPGLLLDFCPECGGAWFEPGELESLGAGVPGFAQTLEYARRSELPSRIPCPHCSAPLNLAYIKEVDREMHICPKCGGSWVDLKTLHVLRAYVEGRPLSAAAGAPPADPLPPSNAPLLLVRGLKLAVACGAAVAIWRTLRAPFEAPPAAPAASAARPAEPGPAPAPIVLERGPSDSALQAMVQAAVKNALKPGARTEVRSDVDNPSYSRVPSPARVALVVGIESYPGLPAAEFAAHDAEAVRDHLLALGFPLRNIMLLTDAEATKGRIAAALNSWLPKHAEEGSTVFFYYSGHGAPDPASRQAYLLPIDGEAEDLPDTALPLRQVYSLLNSLKAERVVVALDSCFSGMGGRSVLARGTRPLLTQVNIKASEFGKLTVLSASGPEQISGALAGEGHGLFTFFFLKGLNGAAVNGQGHVTVSSLYEYLKPQVEDAARRDKRDQTPQFLPGPDPALILR